MWSWLLYVLLRSGAWGSGQVVAAMLPAWT
jgi:hypothetical protein